MIKRILTILVCCFGLCVAFFQYTFAADLIASGACGENVNWVLTDDGILTISGVGEMWNYDNDNSSAPWYEIRTEIDCVVISDGITSIGAYAFCHGSMTSVLISDSVTKIGDHAFDACGGLASVNIPDSVTNIGREAFRSCDSLVSVMIPDSVTSIGICAYEWCENLTGIYVDEENNYYSSDDRGVLFDKSKENLIQVPSAITGEYQIPEGVINIGENAFSFCIGLTHLTIPDSVCSIGPRAFNKCTGLTCVTIPDSVTNIMEEAFCWNTRLTRVTIGTGVNSIGEGAFYGCEWLTDVYYAGSESEWTRISVENSNWDLTDAYIHYQHIHDHSITQVITPNCTEIGCIIHICSECGDYYKDTKTEAKGHKWDAGVITTQPTATQAGVKTYTCSACQTTKTETVPTTDMVASGSCGDNLTWTLTDDGTLTISGTGAMYDHIVWSNRSTIKEIIVQEGVTSIGQGAFCYFDNLTSISIPDTVTSLGKWAFGGCSKLLSIDLPNTITFIGEAAFTQCAMLNHIVLPENMLTIEPELFLECTNLETIILPDNIISIGDQAFDGTKIQSIIIPKSVTKIGQAAFANCSKLEKVNIPYGVTKISANLFSWTQCLKTVDLPDSIKTIEMGAFYSCYGLESIVIPSSVEIIETEAFSNCTLLNTVVFNGKAPNIDGDAFANVEATAYYPSCDSSWTSKITQSYCGTLVWKSMFVRHQYAETVSEPTCTAQGFTTYRCSCGNTYVDMFVQATGHSYNSAVTDPTCTEKGYTTHTCSKCGDSYTDSETPAAGHKWDNGVITTQPTATQTGVKTYTCSVCQTTKTETIPATGGVVVSGTTRVYGNDRYTTAFAAANELKSQLGISKFRAIIVSSGENFADALAGSYLAVVKDAPILLVRNNKNTMNSVKDYIKKNLVSGGTVYLLGGVSAVPAAMESGLDSFTVRRLGGATRYDTNLMILQEAGVTDEDIIVCTGKNFADSLSASATGLPILLVKDGLTAAQKEFLDCTSGRKIIIGGENAVSKRVETQLASYGEVSRLAGSTRYDTSVLVAKTFFTGPSQAVIAYGENFPDGLSGGPMANAIGAPLILTRSGKEKAAMDYISESGITGGYVLGGTAVLPEKTVNKVFGNK